MKKFIIFLGATNAFMCGVNVAAENYGVAALNFLTLCLMGITYTNLLLQESEDEDSER